MGGKVVVFTLGESRLVGVESTLLVVSSVALSLCGGLVLFASRAPFLAFLNSTDVRRPTPPTGRTGGEPSGVTSCTASGCEDGVSPTLASSSPWLLLPPRNDLCRL